MVFGYLGMLKAKGPKVWIHEELQQLREVDFNFKVQSL